MMLCVVLSYFSAHDQTSNKHRHSKKSRKYAPFVTDITKHTTTVNCFEVRSTGFITKSNRSTLSTLHSFMRKDLKKSNFLSKPNALPWYRVAELGSPSSGANNGNENFRQARIYNFRVKCVIFARNRKFAKLTQWNMQYTPCNSALLAQETLFFTQKDIFFARATSATLSWTDRKQKRG